MTEYRRLGKSGLSVSVVGLGCNNLGRANTVTETQAGTDAVVHAALDAGVTLFDVADNYGREPGLSETMLGKALAGRRDDAVVATKFGMDMRGANGPDFGARGSRRYIVRAAEASLRRLGTDWIDLYQFHTPDPLTPIEETLSALDDLVTSGKVRYIGHSNRAGWQIAEAEFVARAAGGTRFISTQNHYNLLDRRAELEVTPAAEAYGLGVLPYFPLANGLLTGKYSPDKAPAGSRLSHTRTHMVHDADWDQLQRYGAFAKERGLSEIQVAFSWLAAQPSVGSVIAGATKPEQIRQNAEAVAWVPTQAELDELDTIFPKVPKVALFLGTPQMTMLLLDVDTGIDDALALAYLASLPEVEFVAVTASPGNVDAHQVARNTLAMLELCGRTGVEVAVGAERPLAVPLVTTPETHGLQGIGYAELPPPSGTVSARHSADVWVEAARANPGQLTALITAPLTNFALAIRREPRLPELLGKVVIMGGSFYHQGNTTPTAEWNTHVDPQAAKEVYAAYRGVPVNRLPIVCSLDTTERIELRPEHVMRLAEAAGCAERELVLPKQPEGLRSTADSPLIRHLSDALRFYFEFHRLYGQGYVAHVHDYFAAGVAAGTLDYATRLATVDVEVESPLLMGTTVADYRNLWKYPPNARIVADNKPEQAFGELIRAIGALAARLR